MNLLEMMRGFTIRTRMLGAIGVVMLLLALLGGAGMMGMLRIQGMSQEFANTAFVQSGYMAQLRMELGGIRISEKDMVIQYEKPEEVRKAYQQWGMFIDKSKQTLGKFVTGADAQNAQLATSIIGHVDNYRKFFEPVARQLEAGGYDSATTANRMSGKALAEVVEADKLLAQLDDLLRQQADSLVAAERNVAGQTSLDVCAGRDLGAGGGDPADAIEHAVHLPPTGGRPPDGIDDCRWRSVTPGSGQWQG